MHPLEMLNASVTYLVHENERMSAIPGGGRAMASRQLILALAAAACLPLPAFAQDTGFFAGVDVTGGMASGSSSTTDGGAAIGGGGVVDNVDFGETFGVGGHIGYRFSPALSAFISYQHVRGDVSWDANFAKGGISGYEGTAISNAVMGNLAYDLALSDATMLRATAGLGLSFNTLSGVVETDKLSGAFLTDVADHTRISPAAQIGAGIEHKFTPNLALGLNASVGYSGGFETGDTRSGNAGITPITPYKIDDVWRASLGASLRMEF